jgi:hypothetical protein
MDEVSVPVHDYNLLGGSEKGRRKPEECQSP